MSGELVVGEKKILLDVDDSDGDESERTSKRRVGSGAVEISAPNEAGVVIPCCEARTIAELQGVTFHSKTCHRTHTHFLMSSPSPATAQTRRG